MSAADEKGSVMTSQQGVTFQAGSRIEEAAKLLVAQAIIDGTATGHFNDIELTASAGTLAEEIVKQYHDASAKRSAEWKASPDGIAAARRSDDLRTGHQATHDALMVALPKLDMRDQSAVLQWLCDMQGPSDHIGVIVRRKSIVLHFEKHGYVVGANCGAAFKPGDRENMFRYLVGQALDGLNGPAIHWILHKMTGEWREQFSVPNPVSGDGQ